LCCVCVCVCVCVIRGCHGGWVARLLPSSTPIKHRTETHAQMIDVIEGNRKYIPAVYVLNKIDQITIEELDIIARLPHCVPISAQHGWNLDELIDKVCGCCGWWKWWSVGGRIGDG
jgi:hypothetical protein